MELGCSILLPVGSSNMLFPMEGIDNSLKRFSELAATRTQKEKREGFSRHACCYEWPEFNLVVILIYSRLFTLSR